MTTKEFLDRYDNQDILTEDELRDLWWGDLLNVEIPVVGKEEYGEPDRWNTYVSKVIQIEDRYFMVYRYEANTEYQETNYDTQPEEVEPYEVTITAWRPVKNV